MATEVIYGYPETWEEWESPFAEQLPQELKDAILRELRIRKRWEEEAFRLAAKEINPDKKQKLVDMGERHGMETNGIIRFLHRVGLHPAYGWVGHRTEYIFPTEAECMAERDWHDSFKE